MMFTECDGLYLHDFEIHVDIWGQLDISKLLNPDRKLEDQGKLDDITIHAPFFPFNTDGIDPSGRNILIERINITNFDDAIAIKPTYYGHHFNYDFNCTENVMVRDVIAHQSLGLSIGSVHPEDGYNCVRNVTFRDSIMYNPFKGIYVKTNSATRELTCSLPGSCGEITNITYENIDIHSPKWWGIYIGPQ